MWVRTVSHADADIQAAGVDVAVQKDRLSADVPHSGPVIAVIDTECGEWFLMGNVTPPCALYMVGDAFCHLLEEGTAYEGWSRLPPGVVIRPNPDSLDQVLRVVLYHVDSVDAYPPGPRPSLSASSLGAMMFSVQNVIKICYLIVIQSGLICSHCRPIRLYTISSLIVTWEHLIGIHCATLGSVSRQ